MGQSCSCVHQAVKSNDEYDADVEEYDKYQQQGLTADFHIKANATNPKVQSAFRGFQARRLGWNMKELKQNTTSKNETVRQVESTLPPFKWDEDDNCSEKLGDPHSVESGAMYIG
jgi:hypothetical protein